MFKIMHNMDRVDKTYRFIIVKTKTRGFCFEYFKEISKHSTRENYLFNRVANTWNSLPSEIVEAETVNSFKTNIDCWVSSNQTTNRLL